MTVADFIEWLKTQDQDRTVEVLKKDDRNAFTYCETYSWTTFDPTLHSSDFFEGTLQIGADD